MNRLIKAIKAGRFNWEKYLGGGYWHGMRIQTQPLFCSYGVIGFTCFSPYGWSFDETIVYDFEFKKVEITTK